ncbi:helix-turn-helix domain-containing protein [Leucobacter sp. Z1108]|uniref:helix-turn-helix domain-containing protein n=1 Tax=Leucobacter sp. Z1108 TaxID=3439066 RepID=UPI003F3FF257
MTMILDTRVVSSDVRPEYWSAGIAEHFFPVRIEPASEPVFEARLSGGQVGPLFVRTISGPPHRVTRTRQLVDRLDPECILMYLPRRGTCRVGQGDRICELRPGEVAVQDTSTPSSFEAVSGFDVSVIAFPKWYIGGDAPAFARHAAERLAGPDSTMLRLSSSLLVGIGRLAEGPPPSSAEGDSVANMMLALLRGLCADHDGDSGANARAATLEARMRQYALAHLADPELGPEQLARAHFVSTRYVHKLFAPLGGVSGWIREQRLFSAARELRETDTPVSEVALQYGYRNAASFARAFRKAQGHSPRESRRARELQLFGEGRPTQPVG